jgi:hypothetical protein
VVACQFDRCNFRQICKDYRSSLKLWATFFLSYRLWNNFDKKLFGLRLGRFFHKLIWSPCPGAHAQRKQINIAEIYWKWRRSGMRKRNNWTERKIISMTMNENHRSFSDVLWKSIRPFPAVFGFSLDGLCFCCCFPFLWS